jgi:hypothetical protein
MEVARVLVTLNFDDRRFKTSGMRAGQSGGNPKWLPQPLRQVDC